MYNFLEYLTSGQITKQGKCSISILSTIVADSGGVIKTFSELTNIDSETQYIKNDTLTDRPANPSTIDTTTITANEEDEAIISDIPNPSTVIVTGTDYEQSYTVTDGEFIFTIDEPGEYTLTVSSEFPYMDKPFVVTASES